MTTANPFAKSRAAGAAGSAPSSNPFGAAKSKPAENSPEPVADGIEAAGVATEPPAPKPSGDPFDMPTGGGSGEKIADFVGELMLLRPTEFIEGLQTEIGTSDAIRADVVLLSGERMGELIEDMLIFQMALRRELKKTFDGPNSYKIGRLGRGVAKKGKSAPYIFEAPEEADVDLARQWLAAQ